MRKRMIVIMKTVMVMKVMNDNRDIITSDGAKKRRRRSDRERQ